MPASYPASIWSPSSITSGVTIPEQLHFDDTVAEVEAVETELGVSVPGSAGSLVERVNMAMDLDGNARGLLRNYDLGNNSRKRIRCGVTEFRVQDLSSETHASRGTINLSPVFKSTAGCFAFVQLQLLEADPASHTIPCFAAYLNGTGTASKFDFLVCDDANSTPDTATAFLLHWIAVEVFGFGGSTTDY